MRLIIVFAMLFLFSGVVLPTKTKSKTRLRSKDKQWFTSTVGDQSIAFDGKSHRITQVHSSMDCPCGSPSCPPCILSKTERKIHERAASDAKADIKTQDTLATEADLQQKLFAQSEKYAHEVAKLEEEARNLTTRLQKVSSMAEIARTKMIKAENEAKQIALKSIRTMTIYPPRYYTKTPEIAMTPAGYTQTVVKEYEPQYNIKIGETDSSGFIDPYKQMIANDIGLDQIKDEVLQKEDAGTAAPAT